MNFLEDLKDGIQAAAIGAVMFCVFFSVVIGITGLVLFLIYNLSSNSQ